MTRIGVDDALERAGCVAGDEVRITGYSFAYEGAEEYAYEQELIDGAPEPSVEDPDETDVASIGGAAHDE